MNPAAILIAAGAVLIAKLLAIAYLFIGLIERAVARFADEEPSVPASPGGSQGPDAASKRGASGPNVHSLHGRDDD